MRDEKKSHFVALTKNVNLIKKLIDKSLYLLLSNKTVAKMWIFFEDRFQHISSINMTHTFADALNTKFSDCKDIVEYMSQY